MVDPTAKIIDNYAGVVEGGNEGSVREVFEHYVTESEKIKDQADFELRMDLGTGYLFFSGFKESHDLFKELTEKRLLKNISDDEKWDTKAPIRVVMGPETTRFTKEVLLSIIKNDISNFNDETIELLEHLVRNDLIEFRVFLDRKFHVKLYSFYLRSSIPDDIWAGSANFTKGGLTDNIELCIPMQTTSSTRVLFRQWFDSLWSMASKDLNMLQIIDEVKESKYLYHHPKIFFTKLIHLLNKQYLLEDEAEEEENILLEFQNLSFYIVMERLQKYGGYILANSVGLGKSYVACQAMKAYLKQKPDKRCLLIYPPRVESEWKGYLDAFGISDKVDSISMGILQKPPYGTASTGYFDYREYADRYSLIIADEAHHYRNTSNRQENLKHLISSNQKADVLFLTATPINLSSEDLFSLIDLFYRGENVSKFENQGLKELYDTTRREIKELKDYRLTHGLLDRIKRVERELNLKISWRIVQEHFEEDLWKLSGQEVKYEEPDTREVSFTYPEEYKSRIFDNIVTFLEGLNYEPAKLWDGKEYRDDKNLIFWYKWQLYKRLESSLYSFYKSVDYLKVRFAVFMDSIEQGVFIDENNLDQLSIKLSKKDYKTIIDENRSRVVFDSFRHLDADLQRKVLENLSEDLRLINRMLEDLKEVFGEMEKIPYEQDKKIQKLKELLRKNLEEGKPTIVFSEFKDTVQYLYESLKGDFENLEFIHGGVDKSKDKLIERFQRGEIDILLTTDILSEGVNIPRADSIVNFDLPYNPVVLVQRAGRALRITNPKKLFIHNFRPETDIDKELELYDRLDLRLKTILDIIGLDFIVWLMDEKKVKEIHEAEKKSYLENYSEYKERVATTDPDKLIRAAMPEESKLDKVLRKAVFRYNITRDLLETINPGIRKPIYTVLKDEEDLFLIAKSGGRIKTINEIRESVEPVKEEKKLGPSDYPRIDSLLNRAKVDLDRERTSRGELTRKLQALLRDLQEARTKLESEDMKATLDRIRELIERQALLPDELLKVEAAVKDIIEQPDIFKTALDEAIRDTDSWKDLEEISRKSPSAAEIELKAFIKYTGG